MAKTQTQDQETNAGATQEQGQEGGRETAEARNTVAVTDVGPSRKKISIEIPAETVASQLGTSLDTLMVEAQLPGFRKGRAPRRLIEKKFGPSVRKEAKEQLVAQAYQAAVEEHKLRVIGDPVSEGLEARELEDGRAFSFEVEVEVPPALELPSLDGIGVKKPTMEVTEAMVAGELDRIRLHEGALESRETPEPGDYLTGRGKMSGPDGKVFLDINDAVVQMPTPDKGGKGMILGLVVEDFAAQLGGPAVGDTVTVKTVGPENHETEGVRGLPLTIEFTVARADRIVPAKTEDLVSRFGMSDEGQLREALRGKMSERVMIEQQSAMRQQVANTLLKAVELELPERLTAAQAARNLAKQRFELMHRGVDAHKIEEHLAELRTASGDAAARELKLFFILDKAAEELGVTVSEGEINGRVAQIAMSRNERPEKLRNELVQRNQIGMVYQQIREHKTLDAILAKAKVSEMEAEAFNALMAEQGGGGAAGGGAGAEAAGGSKGAKGKGSKPGQGEEAGGGGGEGEEEGGEKKPAKKTGKKGGKKDGE